MRLERGKALGGSGKRFTDAIKSLLCLRVLRETAADSSTCALSSVHFIA